MSAPGFFANTPFKEEVTTDPRRLERILARMRLGRVLPHGDLIEPTLFVASNATRGIDEHAINVESGFNAT